MLRVCLFVRTNHDQPLWLLDTVGILLGIT
jgi:hypothetical protein